MRAITQVRSETVTAPECRQQNFHLATCQSPQRGLVLVENVLLNRWGQFSKFSQHSYMIQVQLVGDFKWKNTSNFKLFTIILYFNPGCKYLVKCCTSDQGFTNIICFHKYFTTNLHSLIDIDFMITTDKELINFKKKKLKIISIEYIKNTFYINQIDSQSVWGFVGCITSTCLLNCLNI